MKFIPALLTYVEALIKSGEDFWVNVMVLIVITVMFSFVSTSLIGDKLQFRCVPTNFTNVNVTNNTYYIHYDKYFAEEGSLNVSYFTSIYNSNYCSYRYGLTSKCSFIFSHLLCCFILKARSPVGHNTGNTAWKDLLA